MKSKLFIALFACIVTNTMFPATMYDSFKGNEWKFLEYMFVKKPIEKKVKHPNGIKMLGAVLLTCLSTGALIKPFCNDPELFVPLTTYFCVFLSCVTMIVCDHLFYKKAEYEICTKLITKWQEYKNVIPEPLQDPFEKLYQKHLQGILSRKEVNKMITIIKALVIKTITLEVKRQVY